MTNFNRRDLLKGAGAAAVGAAFWYPSGRVLGANDKLNVAVIGVRGRGTAHIGGLAKQPNVVIKTLCDIDENVLAKEAKDFEAKYKYKVGTEWDMKKVFDDKEIHAVAFATPNHWHALGSIWAAQAGKHVYVEKPACQTLFEGRQMVNAARKHKVLMQVGFQNRSRKNTTAAIKFLHEGKLGKIFRVRGLCYKGRKNIGKYPDGPMAEGAKLPPMVGNGDPYTASYLTKVHYDNWIGPAASKPFNPNRFHYNWHWQWEYGGGDTNNQGPHQFDVGRWGINKDEYPVKVRSFGGLFLWNDTQQETPNEQTTIMEYADGTIFEFATRGLPTHAEGLHKRGDKAGIMIGNIFYGEKGRLEIDDGGHWTAFDTDSKVIADSKSIKDEGFDSNNLTGGGDGDHFTNFVNAVRANKQDMLTCDVEVGFRSTALPLIANISYRLGRELKFDGKKEQFIGDAQANKMLKRNDRKGYVVPNLGGVGSKVG